jgi:hypothetical protein
MLSARNQNDFVRSANRGCWLGLDGGIFQAAIRRVPQPSVLRLRVLTFYRRVPKPSSQITTCSIRFDILAFTQC